MQVPSLSCYLVHLNPKYSPLHPILKHSQPTFLPQCKRPIFKPIQNNRQKYNYVYLNLYISVYQTVRQNTLQAISTALSDCSLLLISSLIKFLCAARLLDPLRQDRPVVP